MTLDIQLHLNRGGFTLDVAMRFGTGITALFGPSGAGKSTLLHCIAGLIKPDAGQIRLDGQTLFCSDTKTNVPACRRNVGLVFQDNLLFPHLSVGGNLKYGQPLRKDTQELEQLIELLDIQPLLNRRIDGLSGGEKKRVAIARAILNKPRRLLLDEPFSGLDESLKHQIILYLLRLQRVVSVPMILVSHSPDEIVNLADEVIFMEDGRLNGKGRLSLTASAGTAGFCGSENSAGFRNLRNWLTRNHSLQFRLYRSG